MHGVGSRRVPLEHSRVANCEAVESADSQHGGEVRWRKREGDERGGAEHRISVWR